MGRNGNRLHGNGSGNVKKPFPGISSNAVSMLQLMRRKYANDVVRFVVTHGVCVRRMRSPVGRNAQHCAAVYNVSLEELAVINKKRVHDPCCMKTGLLSYSSLCKINQIIKLLLVKHHYAFLRSFVPAKLIVSLCTA